MIALVAVTTGREGGNPRAAMERVGDYVRRALPRHPEIRDLQGWETGVAWDR